MVLPSYAGRQASAYLLHGHRNQWVVALHATGEGTAFYFQAVVGYDFTELSSGIGAAQPVPVNDRGPFQKADIASEQNTFFFSGQSGNASVPKILGFVVGIETQHADETGQVPQVDIEKKSGHPGWTHGKEVVIGKGWMQERRVYIHAEAVVNAMSEVDRLAIDQDEPNLGMRNPISLNRVLYRRPAHKRMRQGLPF